jgi:hypothetical protein
MTFRAGKKLVTIGAIGTLLWAQSPSETRREYLQKFETWQNAQHGLENLLGQRPADAQKHIRAARDLADQYTNAKRAYWQTLSRDAGADIDRIDTAEQLGRLDPAEIKASLARRKSSLDAALDAARKQLRDVPSDLKYEVQRTQIQKQIEGLNEMLAAVSEAYIETDQQAATTVDVKQAQEKLHISLVGVVKTYRSLVSLAEREHVLWDQYYDELAQLVHGNANITEPDAGKDEAPPPRTEAQNGAGRTYIFESNDFAAECSRPEHGSRVFKIRFLDGSSATCPGQRKGAKYVCIGGTADRIVGDRQGRRTHEELSGWFSVREEREGLQVRWDVSSATGALVSTGNKPFAAVR